MTTSGNNDNIEKDPGLVRDLVNTDLSYIKQEDPHIVKVEMGIVPNMKVPGRIYVNDTLRKQLEEELEHYHKSEGTSFIPALLQIGNAASLSGIVGASIGLPDIHTGYGFAIGHVAAFDMDNPESVVSPGGVGFDINCGVRMLRTNLKLSDILPLQKELTKEISRLVPVGVGGRARPELQANIKTIRDIMLRGMGWAVENGFAWSEDMERCEENGCINFGSMEGLDLNQRAEARGMTQLGTLGSGNHYIEVQSVSDIFEKETAAAMGITQTDQICIMIHCGSRGLGHQIADDAVRVMTEVMKRDGIVVNDPMLACGRIQSNEGQKYLKQMAAAANFAFVNRSIIAHFIRKAFENVFKKSAKELDMHLVYDVAHNIAKVEKHVVDGVEKSLLVHRKGSSRAFPPGHPDLPKVYESIGQPVLVGGSMGTCSYVLVGTEKAMQETFGSTCHGAGRAKARSTIRALLTKEEVLEDLYRKGITIEVGSEDSIAEEAPSSYKDVTQVVDTCHSVGISRKVCRLEPRCVVKG